MHDCRLFYARLIGGLPTQAQNWTIGTKYYLVRKLNHRTKIRAQSNPPKFTLRPEAELNHEGQVFDGKGTTAH